MELKQAFFILRHGSAEGLPEYLKAIKTIEDNCLPRHGRWDAKIMKDIGTYTVYWCSECNCCSYFKYNYCPNCGAKMRGDTDE